MLRSLHFTVKNLRNITHVISQETCFKVSVQHYGRFVSRRPVAIVNQDELFDIEENISPTPTHPKVKKRNMVHSIKSKKEETIETLLKEPIFDTEDEIGSQMGTETFIKSNNKVQSKPKEINVQKIKKPKPEKETVFKNMYSDNYIKNTNSVSTKLYENEKLMSSIMMNVKSKKKRKKNEQILLEGHRFIRDAIEAGLVPEFIIFNKSSDIEDLPISKEKTKLYKVPYRSIQLWSTMTTSPGIMGIFKKPEPISESKSSLPITIICDNIRDPGNMGTILRAAAGVGCERLILTKGCVDFWDFKVLRSAAGAHYRVPIYGSKNWEEIRNLLHSDANVYVADNNSHSCMKKYKTNYLEENDNDENDDDENEMIKHNRQPKRNKNPIVNFSNLPIVPYYSVDFTKNEVVLIVGGETEGISPESYKLVEDRQGVRVNVPLNNNIDSLNAGMALGVIAFEVKRQFLLTQSKLNELIV